MGMSVGGGSGDVMGEINVTPFVDVCLVLLIIFMVVTPMLQTGVPVELPPAKSVIDKPDEEKILQIVLDRNLNVYVRDNKVPIGNIKSNATQDDIRRRMSLYFRENPAEFIQIKADRNQRYGHVKSLMKMVQETGMKEVTLVAEELEPPS